MSGAKALIEALKREKVEAVFGMPGGANLPIYDAMYDSGIRHILVRHEQSAGHMADGYGRAARRAGVCMATSGPGATNLVTAIGTAYADSTPVVAITGQVPTHMIGRDAFQECDIIGIITPITKYAYQPREPHEVPSTVRKAFYIAETGRPGPVVIDVPKDVQTGSAEMTFPESVTVRGYTPHVEPDPVQVERAVELLLSAERPMIMSGGGVIIGGAFAELQALAELLVCPVVTTFKGKGGFPEQHPLSLGPIGMHGHAEANKLVIEADVLLAAGARFSDRSVGRFDEFGKDGMRIVHVDIDPSEIGKNKPADVAVLGDVKVTLRRIVDAIMRRAANRGNETTWMKHVEQLRSEFRDRPRHEEREITPYKMLKALREVFPPEGIATTEVGQCQMWASLFYDVIRPGTFFSSTGLGTMGFGFPAAIGAKVARPEVPVVDIAGDGGFNMTENSLAVSVVEKIPVIVALMNNDSLGMVAQWQRMFFDKRLIGVKMRGVPDYAKVAEAYGAQGVHVATIEEFKKAVRLGLRSEVATVIDVPIHPEEDVFPFVVPGTALKDMIVA